MLFRSDQCILVNFSSLDLNPDDYLYHHALNTCLLSINIATILGYSESQILEVGEAGLLADLGMMLTPLAIRQKPGRSEERRVGKECRSRWSAYH